MTVTRADLEAIREINAVTSYPDSQAVYLARRTYRGQGHEHYWSFWRACRFGNSAPAEGIRCYVCDKVWIEETVHES